MQQQLGALKIASSASHCLVLLITTGHEMTIAEKCYRGEPVDSFAQKHNHTRGTRPQKEKAEAANANANDDN